MTQPDEDYTPGDREGYTVTEQGGTDFLGRQTQVTFSVVRDSDGVGLGAYARQEEVDAVINHDRGVVANQARTD